MNAILEMFRQGGVWMYLELGIVILLIPAIIGTLGAAGFRFFTGRSGRTSLVLGFLTLFGAVLLLIVGYAGYQFGLSEMQAALAAVDDPEMARKLELEGREIANYPLDFALYVAPLPAFIGVVGVVTHFIAKDESL